MYCAFCRKHACLNTEITLNIVSWAHNFPSELETGESSVWQTFLLGSRVTNVQDKCGDIWWWYDRPQERWYAVFLTVSYVLIFLFQKQLETHERSFLLHNMLALITWRCLQLAWCQNYFKSGRINWEDSFK